MQEIEEMFVSGEHFREFCLADADLSGEYVDETNTGVVCKQPYSALGLWSEPVLQVVEPALSGTLLADMTQEQIISVFQKAMANDLVWVNYFGLFESSVQPGAEYVKVARTIFPFGSPI